MSDDLFIFSDQKPVRADAVRNHRLLLNTARRLFKEQTINDVTMSAIAKAAGVGKGTLYRHFDDKADLCHALLDEAMRDFQQATLQKMKAGDAETVLRWFLQATVDYVDQNSDLLHEAAIQSNEEMWRHPAHIWWRQTIRGLLERLQPAGDLDYMADVLYIMLDVQTMRFQQQNGYSQSRIKEGLLLLLERFLLSPA